MMPTKIRIFKGYVREYQEYMSQRNLSQRYIDEFYRRNMYIANTLLEAGLDINPKLVTEKEVAFVLKNLPGLIRTQQYYFEFFRLLLEYHGNTIVREMNIRWPKYHRTSVQWLEPEQQKKIISVANLEQRLLIVLELGMGLRRKEVRMLTMKDINLNNMHVQGKGRMGAKWRTIPIHGSFPEIYEEYMIYRDGLIREAMLRNEGKVDAPENLIIYIWGKKLDYKKNRALDNIHYRVTAKCGVKYSHHDLRRSFGRNMWKLKVPLETIAEMMGHENTQQTKKYLGITITDMQDGMQKYSSAFPLK